MILLADNEDSFTHNLAQALAGLGREVRVVPGRGLTVAEVLAEGPEGVLVGPGPGEPDAALVELVRELPRHVPVLGVCLGHQALGLAHGARLTRADELVHGETRPVHHDGRGVFEDLPTPLDLTRYNSLVLDPDGLDPELEVSARGPSRAPGDPRGMAGEVQALRHRTLPVESVQFHPESILCVDPWGTRLLANWLRGLERG